MKIKKQLISSSRYSVKSPYQMNPIGLTIHNTANDASAKNEIAYMVRNNNQVSYHIAVDDKEAIQAIPFNRNAWHAGDSGSGEGNRKHIGLEICYSKSGGPKFDKAEENAANVAAQILKQFGWTTKQLRRHKDHSGKNCPHRTMAKGWSRFVKMVDIEMKGEVETPNMYYHRTHNNKHPRVKKLQEDLNKLGYNLSVDVIFGPSTEKAILDYQKKNELKVNGIADTDTLRHIMYAVRNLDKPKENKELYKVQVGAYGVKDNADKKLKDLKSKGFDGYIKKE